MDRGAWLFNDWKLRAGGRRVRVPTVTRKAGRQDNETLTVQLDPRRASKLRCTKRSTDMNHFDPLFELPLQVPATVVFVRPSIWICRMFELLVVRPFTHITFITSITVYTTYKLLFSKIWTFWWVWLKWCESIIKSSIRANQNLTHK